MSGDEKAARLAGLRVLLTRPAHQAAHLRALIEREEGIVHSIPMIEIAEPSDLTEIYGQLQRLDEYGLAIFVSPNAVDATFDLLARPWPAGLRVAAIGRGTASALSRRGVHVDIAPARDFTSEGLLSEPDLQEVRGMRVVIFRGSGGRELLADALRSRGASVQYVDVYRRRLPATAMAALDRLIGGPPVDIIVATSNEGLMNLFECAGERHRDWLLARQLVVMSERTAALAVTLGFEKAACVASEASDQGLLDAIARAASIIRAGTTA
jgi:uroporphyrinogen-III synthase